MTGVHIAQVTCLDLDVRLTIGFSLGAKLLGYSGFVDCDEDGRKPSVILQAYAQCAEVGLLLV